MNSLGKLKERKWSADLSQLNMFEDGNASAKKKKFQMERKKQLISKIENSTFLNCENIKISIINNDDEIERDSLEFGNKILGNVKNNVEKKENEEVFYGSPAIWLKNKKRHSDGKKIKFQLIRHKYSDLNISRVKDNKNKSTSPSRSTSQSASPFNLNKEANSPVMLKICLEDDKDKKIPLYNRRQSFIEALIHEKRTRNNLDKNSFNLNSSTSNRSKRQFKTLISNKLQIKNKENKFNNINHLGSVSKSKMMSTIDKGEIDEIINTEISEIYLKNNKSINLVKSSMMLKNRIFKIKYPNCLELDKIDRELKNTIYINNSSQRISKTHLTSEEIESNSNENGDKKDPVLLTGNNNSDSNNSKTSQSCSMYNTINDKLQLDKFLHSTHSGKINWRAGEIIAEGSSSVIYKALNVDEGNLFVVKRLSKINDPRLLKFFKNEVEIVRQLDHPNIIKYIESDCIENNLFIYLEYVSGGSIKYIIDKYGPLNEKITRIYLKQILDGLEYLHSKKIVHRDIKCANILLDVKGNIKLSDFGCSCAFYMKYDNNSTHNSSICNSDEFLDSLKGTLPWMAPEVVLQHKYGKKADVWSLGCTLVELTTGQPPWGKLDNCYIAMTKIGRSNDIPEIPSFLSEPLKDFILKCLNRNPKERPNIFELKQHSFIQMFVSK